MRSSISKSGGIDSIAFPAECSTSKYLYSHHSCNYKDTKQGPLENKILFRRRSLPSKYNGSIDDIVVSEVPEILPCNSSASDASASTLTASASTSFDSNADSLHKLYYSYNVSGPIAMPGQAVPTPIVSSATQVPHQHHVHPQKEVMKRHRRDKTATLGMVGAGVGTLILPVIGTVVGGVITGYATNQSLKRYEKKIQRKWEQDQFQKNASASQAARHAVFV